LHLFHPRSYPEKKYVRQRSTSKPKQVDAHNVKRFHLPLEHKAAASAIFRGTERDYHCTRGNNQHRKNTQLRLIEHFFSSVHDYLFTRMRIEAASNAPIAVSLT